MAFLLRGGRRGTGLLHTCNTACNIAYNIAMIVKTLLGMIGGSWDSRYWTPDTSCHQACSLLSKQSLPLTLISIICPSKSSLCTVLFPFQSFHRNNIILPLYMTNLSSKSGLSPARKRWATHSFWYARVNAFQQLVRCRLRNSIQDWSSSQVPRLACRWPHRKLVQAAENPPKKLNFSQISFLNWPTISTNMSLHHGDVPEQLDLQQHL